MNTTANTTTPINPWADQPAGTEPIEFVFDAATASQLDGIEERMLVLADGLDSLPDTAPNIDALRAQALDLLGSIHCLRGVEWYC